MSQAPQPPTSESPRELMARAREALLRAREELVCRRAPGALTACRAACALASRALLDASGYRAPRHGLAEHPDPLGELLPSGPAGLPSKLERVAERLAASRGRGRLHWEEAGGYLNQTAGFLTRVERALKDLDP